MNPSGGLSWHWRAWRATQPGAAWAPTCAALARWLENCKPQSRQLLLLGPSAGWMLPTRWLLGFESITAVDIDPWARRLFALRHGRQLTGAGVPWRYLTQDALAHLPALLAERPQAFVFFDNLLGQLRFHAPKASSQADIQAIEDRLQAVVQHLARREWGSVHDLVSGSVSKSLWTDPLGKTQKYEIVDSAIFPPAQSCEAGDAVASGLFPAGARNPWLDHLTGSMLPSGTPVQRVAWAFNPAYWHVLEAGWVRP